MINSFQWSHVETTHSPVNAVLIEMFNNKLLIKKGTISIVSNHGQGEKGKTHAKTYIQC